MTHGSPRIVNMMGLRVRKLVEHFNKPDETIEGIVIGQPNSNIYLLMDDNNKIHNFSYAGTQILAGQTIDTHDVIHFEQISQTVRDAVANLIAQTCTRGH
ncbi:MAG: hypothetical protein ACXABY_02850 [Candidatus Thorarchaeota archaeon]|jgi:hypothetical protein